MKKITLLVLVICFQFFFQSCDNDDNELPDSTSLNIGDYYQNSIIFYLDDSGEHGLACDVIDLGFDKEWGCPTLIDFGAKGVEIGTGEQNTLDIVTVCDDSTIAAALCDQLVRNDQEDWFLPSKEELNVLYQNQIIINETALKNNGGSFSNGGRYWSSSHQLDNTVWVQYFNTGQQDGVNKDTQHYVRAIRAF